jgi:hypothetical protein
MIATIADKRAERLGTRRRWHTVELAWVLGTEFGTGC